MFFCRYSLPHNSQRLGTQQFYKKAGALPSGAEEGCSTLVSRVVIPICVELSLDSIAEGQALSRRGINETDPWHGERLGDVDVTSCVDVLCASRGDVSFETLWRLDILLWT